MKTKEELAAPRDEVATLNEKLAALSEDKLKEVAGGRDLPTPSPDLPSGKYYEAERLLIRENTETILRGSHEIPKASGAELTSDKSHPGP